MVSWVGHMGLSCELGYVRLLSDVESRLVENRGSSRDVRSLGDAELQCSGGSECILRCSTRLSLQSGVVGVLSECKCKQ
jgi:hypothetical protein